MSPPINPSLLKKHAARQLAVQCLYQRGYMESPPPAEQLIARVLQMQENEEDQSVEPEIEPDEKLLRGIVAGSGDQSVALEEKIGAALGQRWQGERLTPLMKAILRAAAYELAYHPELSTAIILDEYVSLASDYFATQETNLLNGLVQGLAKHIRPRSSEAV